MGGFLGRGLNVLLCCQKAFMRWRMPGCCCGARTLRDWFAGPAAPTSSWLQTCQQRSAMWALPSKLQGPRPVLAMAQGTPGSGQLQSRSTMNSAAPVLTSMPMAWYGTQTSAVVRVPGSDLHANLYILGGKRIVAGFLMELRWELTCTFGTILQTTRLSCCPKIQGLYRLCPGHVLVTLETAHAASVCCYFSE